MNYHNIISIALYETKILRRDWSFRCIALLAVVFVTFLQLITQSDFNKPEWYLISLTSSIPFTNTYLVNYVQTFIAIFLVGRFIFQTRKPDTSDAIRIRPYANTEFLWGKTIGFGLVTLGLDLLLMGIGMLIHLVASQDSPWSLLPYLFYFFTLIVPVLIFTLGLSMWVKSITKHQALSLLILLVFFYLNINYGPKLFHGVADVYASTLPNTFSDWTGFSGLGLYLTQRLILLLWGVGFLVLSIATLRRLPNRPQNLMGLRLLGVLFLVAGLLPAGLYNATFTRELKARDSFRQTFIKYEETPKSQITDHRIDFEQRGETFKATSRLSLLNPHKKTLTSLVLYLNPGLTVQQVTSAGQSLPFNQEQQIVLINQTLSPGESQEIEVVYDGYIVPEACYAELDDVQHSPSRSLCFFNFGRDFFYLQDDLTLLTPECLWYPVATPPVHILSPYTTPRTFTNFELKVIGETQRVAISQGTPIITGDTTRFENHQKLTGLSLCIGNYTRKSITVDDILFEAYLFKEHENILEKLQDHPELIKMWLEQLSRNNQRYPYKKLALIETPVHFCSFSRLWKNGSEYTQPELFFRPEREALNRLPLSPQYMELEYVDLDGKNVSEKHIKADTENWNFNRSLPDQNIFITKITRHFKWKKIKNEHDINAILGDHNFYLSSSEFLCMNDIFQMINSQWREFKFDSYAHLGFFEQEALHYLEDHSLEEALKDPQAAPLLLSLYSIKSNVFAKTLLLSAPHADLGTFIQEFMNNHQFQPVTFEEFCEAFQTRFGKDIRPAIQEWYTQSQLPAFLVKDITLEEAIAPDGKPGILRTVKIWNKGKVDGLITLSTSVYSWIPEHYAIPAGTCKMIKSYFESDESREISIEVNTNLSFNKPEKYSYPDLKVIPSTTKFAVGTFDIDTTEFAPNPNEFVVDNEDPGFHILKKSNALKDMMKEEKAPRRQLQNQVLPEWTLYIGEDAYGEMSRSYYCKRSGNGDLNVEWETQLPVDGLYELFVYNFEQGHIYRDQRMWKTIGRPKEGQVTTQIYLFSHEAGEEKIVLETDLAGNGWVSLGKYQFKAGKTKVTLSDIGAAPDQAIFADAMKWVKR